MFEKSFGVSLNSHQQCHCLIHRSYGITIGVSNTCTLSLVQFDGPPGNEIVLEGYQTKSIQTKTKPHQKLSKNDVSGVLNIMGYHGQVVIHIGSKEPDSSMISRNFRKTFLEDPRGFSK